MTLVGLDAPTIISDRHFSQVQRSHFGAGGTGALPSPQEEHTLCQRKGAGSFWQIPRGKNLFHAQLALFASDLFVIAGTHAPDPVVAESPRGNMLS